MTRPHLAPTALLLVPLALLAAAGVAWGSVHALRDSGDLLRRAEEVALFVAGQDPYADPDLTYPPSALLVFTPLVGPFGPFSLKLLWLALNLGALAATLALTIRLAGPGWDRPTRAAFILIALASKPVRLTLGLGQFSLIPLALALAAVLLARKGRQVAAGLLLAVSLVKPTIAAPFLILLAVGGKARAAAAACLAQGAAIGAVSAWLDASPRQLLAEWMLRARSQQAAGLIDLPSVGERLWPGASAYAGPIGLAMLGATALVLRPPGRPLAARVAAAGWFAALSSYHRPYDLVLLLPALAQGIEAARAPHGRATRARLGMVAALAVLLIAPSHPTVVDERLYESLIIPLAYLLFAASLFDLLRPPTTLHPAGAAPHFAPAVFSGSVPGSCR